MIYMSGEMIQDFMKIQDFIKWLILVKQNLPTVEFWYFSFNAFRPQLCALGAHIQFSVTCNLNIWKNSLCNNENFLVWHYDYQFSISEFQKIYRLFRSISFCKALTNYVSKGICSAHLSHSIYWYKDTHYIALLSLMQTVYVVMSPSTAVKEHHDHNPLL